MDILHCIEGVDDDEEEDHQERHSARNDLEQLECDKYSFSHALNGPIHSEIQRNFSRGEFSNYTILAQTKVFRNATNTISYNFPPLNPSMIGIFIVPSPLLPTLS